MNRFLIGFLAAACVAAAVKPLAADEPPHAAFSPAPPGTVVQSQLVYLAGESMHSQWRGVLSKASVGKSDGSTYYQWYFSLYAIDGAVYRLKYRSPKASIPFDAVAKAHGAQIWFPMQDARIVGAGEFMGPGTQQLVVQSHATGADCGNGRVDAFFFDAAMQRVMTTLSIENGCSLNARIVHEPGGDALQLTGPYYAANAPRCCPTKAKATSVFRFHNGTWTQTPRYFEVVAGST